jgi:hypothetical protein
MARLLHNLEVLDSNLDLQTDYPDGNFGGFPQYVQTDAGIVPAIRSQQLPSTSIVIHYQLRVTIFLVLLYTV